MKVFWSTLAAILVAAAIIGFVMAASRAHENAQKLNADIRRIRADTEGQRAFNEWYDRSSKDPQFDPNHEKLLARMREVKDAIDNEKPIPPNPWQTQTAVDAPAPAPTVMIKLKESVTVKTQSGSVTIPAGTEVQFVSQINDKVHVRHLNGDYYIPISATDLKARLSRPSR
jgi:hypothetical protein